MRAHDVAVSSGWFAGRTTNKSYPAHRVILSLSKHLSMANAARTRESPALFEESERAWRYWPDYQDHWSLSEDLNEHAQETPTNKVILS